VGGIEGGPFRFQTIKPLALEARVGELSQILENLDQMLSCFKG